MYAAVSLELVSGRSNLPPQGRIRPDASAAGQIAFLIATLAPVDEVDQVEQEVVAALGAKELAAHRPRVRLHPGDGSAPAGG